MRHVLDVLAGIVEYQEERPCLVQALDQIVDVLLEGLELDRYAFSELVMLNPRE